MKRMNFKSVVAVLLTLCMLMCMVPTFSFSALAETKDGYIVLNDATDSATAGSFNAEALSAAKGGSSLDGKIFKGAYLSSKSSDTAEWWFALDVDSSVKNAEGYAIYVDFSDITTVTRLKVSVGSASFSRNGALAMKDVINAASQKNNITLIYDDGYSETISQMGAYGEDLGFNLPAGFKGYVVLKAFGDMSKADTYNVMHVARSADVALADFGAEVAFDSILAITNISDFVSGGYQSLTFNKQVLSMPVAYGAAAQSAADAEKVSVVLNDGSDKFKVSGTGDYKINNSRVLSGDADGYSYRIWNGLNTLFDVSTPDNCKGVEAYAFYVNATQFTLNDLSFTVALKNSHGDEITDVRAAGTYNYADEYYLVAQNGTKQTLTSNGVSGITIPKGFAGYVILPVTENTAGYNYKNVTYFDLYSTVFVAVDGADGASRICIDNIAAVFDMDTFMTDAGYCGVHASSTVDYRTTVTIPANATTASFKWTKISGASRYEVYLYSANENNNAYTFNAKQNVSTNAAEFTGLVPNEKYAVQVVTYSSDGYLSHSFVKEFTAAEKGNYTLIDDCTTLENISTDFPNLKLFESAVFPDGKGIEVTSLKNKALAFDFEERVDLTQYEALCLYINMPTDANAAPGGFSFKDWYSDLNQREKITKIIKDDASTSTDNHLWEISTATGESKHMDSADWEDQFFTVKPGESKYMIFDIGNMDFTQKKLVSQAVFTACLWYNSSNDENNRKPIYFDSFALIENVDLFLADQGSNVNKLGFVNATTTTKPTITPGSYTTTGQNMSVSWIAISGATQYNVNVYNLSGGKPVLQNSYTTTARSRTVKAEYGKDMAVQIVAKNVSGKIVGAHVPYTFSFADFLPEMLGATFNADNEIKFIANGPADIIDGYKVTGYGVLMLPENLLTGELTTATSNALKVSFDTTPALSSEYYATLQGKELGDNEKIAARAYVSYANEAGTSSFTLYSNETITRNIEELSRDMANAVLLYKDSAEAVVKFNSTVTKDMPHKDVYKANANGVKDFVLKNTDAVQKAYNRVVIDSASHSKLNDKNDFVYYYENDNYFYGITKAYAEVISFKTENGDAYDAIRGAGEYSIIGQDAAGNNVAVYRNAGIAAFEQIVVDGETALKVHYNTTGVEVTEAAMSTTYVFHENSIGVNADVRYENPDYTMLAGSSSLHRNLLTDYDTMNRIWAADWVYPANGDAPYKMTDSWVQEYLIGGDKQMYTFLRGNIPTELWWFEYMYPERNLNLYFEDGKAIDYTTEYDLVLNTSRQDKADYRAEAMFSGKDSDFEAFVFSPDATDNTSLFVGDRAEVDIKVGAIKEEGAVTTTTYTVYDYYGNLIASDTKTATLADGESETYRININKNTHGYGIFFLNLTVQTNDYEYVEYYPFALLSNYDYKYYANNPFGIDQFLTEEHWSFDDQWSIINKLGIARHRAVFMGVPFGTSDYTRNLIFLNKMKQKGITTTGHAGDKEILLPYYQDYIYGNENNLCTINGTTPLQEAFDNYYNNYLLPSYEFTQKHGKTNVLPGVSGGQTAWFDTVYNNGAWNMFGKVSLHAYAAAVRPDSNISYLWSVEGGLDRTRKALDRLGNKPFTLDETGYYTLAGSLTKSSLRSQSEYNTRCYFLGLEYGAESVLTYCILDYSNAALGTCLSDMEHHFGHFYYPDYYGRILPKPVAVSFANMTRVCESYTGLTVSNLTTDNLQVYEVQTELKGKVYVAWSNHELFAIDQGKERTPKMPWVGEWTTSQNLVISTNNASVQVYDAMGNVKTYTASNGKVTVPVTGETIYIVGA